MHRRNNVEQNRILHVYSTQRFDAVLAYLQRGHHGCCKNFLEAVSSKSGLLIARSCLLNTVHSDGAFVSSRSQCEPTRAIVELYWRTPYRGQNSVPVLVSMSRTTAYLACDARSDPSVSCGRSGSDNSIADALHTSEDAVHGLPRLPGGAPPPFCHVSFQKKNVSSIAEK